MHALVPAHDDSQPRECCAPSDTRPAPGERPGQTHGMRRWTLLLTLCVCLLAACGGEETERAPAVEAQEGNTAQLGGIAYRVVLFRQLNPETRGDDALIEDVSVGEGRGLFAAFIEACNWSGEQARPTDDLVLEDAFGAAYEPVVDGLNQALTYTPRSLEANECAPAAGTAADRTFDGGGAVVFEAPLDITQERPLILEIRDGADEVRIVLDL